MLCVVIFYGMISFDQMCMLVLFVCKWDKGYGYWIMCQNIQYNWLMLVDILDMLDVLVEVGLYVIQILGNIICNVMIDVYVGVVVDEVVDLCFYGEFIW